jgi:hypothetical protein
LQQEQQQDNSNGITVTMKSDDSYGATWVIVRGPDVGYVKSLLGQVDGDFAFMLGKAEASVKRTGDQSMNQARQALAQGGIQTSTVESDGAFYDQQTQGQGSYQPQQQYAPQAPSQAPQAASQAPAGNPPLCAHGPRQWKEGVSKAGNPYKMWACPSRDRNDQCQPQWAK